MNSLKCCVYFQIKQNKIRVIHHIEREREREITKVLKDYFAPRLEKLKYYILLIFPHRKRTCLMHTL